LGAEFIDAVYQAIEFVRDTRAAGAPIREGLRRWLVRRFPYSVIYREEDDRMYVLAIAHHRRRPDYWRERSES
jgi:toxin ParE1/3/4